MNIPLKTPEDCLKVALALSKESMSPCLPFLFEMARTSPETLLKVLSEQSTGLTVEQYAEKVNWINDGQHNHILKELRQCQKK